MNIAALIQEQARLHPNKASVTMWDGSFYTFAQFERRSQQIAQRLHNSGVRPGARVALFVRPSLDFSIITFALFKLGAIPVLIDPGMGRKNLLKALSDVAPEGMIAVNVVHVLRRIFASSFKSVKWAWTVSPNFFLAPNLLKDLDAESTDFKVFDAKPTDTAAILFTSGGTGTPKGVMTTHGILTAQTHMLQEMFALDSSHKDLPGFPLFALFTLAMGMTSVIPDMDPTKPAKCDPAKIVPTLINEKITFCAGSPAIWERVGQYCLDHKITLPHLQHVVMFGAPVQGVIHEMWAKILPNGTTHTPYGATECLPVACMSGREILKETWPKTQTGAGTCVGPATPGNKIIIIEATDIPEATLKEVPRGTIGEIVVQGPTVTPGYFAREEATKLAKIPHADGLCHRMGDVGYLDEQGRVWFCGRKVHVVGTHYPIPCEAIFNQHPAVKRTALVSLKDRAGIVVEMRAGFGWSHQIKNELKALGAKHPHTAHIQDFFPHPGFPVDVRHNIKIDRVALSAWAQKESV